IVEMRDLLKRARSRRMPDAQPVDRENAVDGARRAADRERESTRGRVIDAANVRYVLPGNDEEMAGVELPEIEKRQCAFVFVDHARPHPASADPAEHAVLLATALVSPHRTTCRAARPVRATML